MKTLSELMQAYNKAIESYNRANEFFEDELISIESKQSRLDDAKKLLYHLNGLFIAINEMGYEMQEHEFWQGFTKEQIHQERRDASCI